ncbi:hypothetical protein ABK040_015302 [Willaertia magna]
MPFRNKVVNPLQLTTKKILSIHKNDEKKENNNNNNEEHYDNNNINKQQSKKLTIETNAKVITNNNNNGALIMNNNQTPSYFEDEDEEKLIPPHEDIPPWGLDENFNNNNTTTNSNINNNIPFIKTNNTSLSNNNNIHPIVNNSSSFVNNNNLISSPLLSISSSATINSMNKNNSKPLPIRLLTNKQQPIVHSSSALVLPSTSLSNTPTKVDEFSIQVVDQTPTSDTSSSTPIIDTTITNNINSTLNPKLNIVEEKPVTVIPLGRRTSVATSNPYFQQQKASSTSSSKKKKGPTLKINVPFGGKKVPGMDNDFTVSQSGTWKAGEIEIGKYGLKESSSTSDLLGNTGSATISPSNLKQESLKVVVGNNNDIPVLNVNNNIQDGNLKVNATISSNSSNTNTPRSETTPISASSGGSGSIEGISPNSNQALKAINSFGSTSGNSTTPRRSKIQYEDLSVSKKSELGAGASAKVIKVHLKSNKKKKFALKIIDIYEENIKPKQIISEVKALYDSASCENVVKMYEAFHREGTIRLLLEYMDLGSLEDVYTNAGIIPEDVLSEITFQMLKALDYLEGMGIIHRDIKPANILINKKGVVKLTDFGMSQQSQTKMFKTFQGTYFYMSPERLRGANHSFDSDIWSLGVSIAECATGSLPFEGGKETTLWHLLQYVSEHKLSIKKGQVSDELYDFINRCMEVDPKDRPSAKELMSHPFIKKYIPNTDVFVPDITRRWIKEVYLPLKKQKDLEKKQHEIPKVTQQF